MSERRQLEQQLLQAQKMEGLGRLAGSVAHDFNNVLTAVLGFSELILSQLSPKVPIGKDVDEIRRAALQGRHLTEQLLAFSRRRPRALHRLNLTDVARSSRDLLQQLVGEGVAIRVTLDDDVWRATRCRPAASCCCGPVRDISVGRLSSPRRRCRPATMWSWQLRTTVAG